MPLRHSRVRVTLAALFAVVVLNLATAAEPPEVPAAKDLKDAVDALRDVYEKDYKDAETDNKAKKALARKLFEGAAKRKTAVMQYASYDEARRLAATGGDPKLALDAMAALSTKFRGTSPDLATETLKLLGDADLSPADSANLLAMVSESAQSALEREDYPGAVALGKLAVAAAKKTEDPEVVVEARKFLNRAEALKVAVETIVKEPNNTAANESLGMYWAFTRGRWDVGLKYLKQASSPELATAATKDLANPKSAKERTAVADAWYKLAKEYKGAEHKRLVERAWEWYSGALAVATGDEDLKPGERIKEIEKAHPDLFDLSFAGHTGAAAAVAVTPDGKTLVSVGNDHSVRVWSLATGKLQKTLDGHTAWVGSVVVTPDGERAVTAGGDNVIRVWDLKAGKEITTIEGHSVAIRGLALTSDGKVLISGASDKTCRAWNLATGKEIKRYGDGKESVESVAVSPDGKLILTGNDVGVVTVFDAKTGDVVSTYNKHGGSMVYTVAVSADGKTAFSGARDKDVHVWEVATGKELKRLKGHTEQVYQIALAPGGKTLASASYDKTVRLWDVATGKEVKKFEGHADGVQGVCFTPEGRFVFSASWDKAIRKWRLPLFAPAGKRHLPEPSQCPQHPHPRGSRPSTRTAGSSCSSCWPRC